MSTPKLKEFECIVLTEPVVSDDGDVIPAGAEGVIVDLTAGVHIVEFDEPVGALANVEPHLMRPLPTGK